ncbi:unnamed protein product [Cylindrotheca closterium]|uniref:Uncharacterized protein n=1 Tax=Cylindrotheca closterium TaxID=2856 RepID=A0AAD2CUQ5_9STRA|nr:unnamed protein product [Cylindrotheca closterium]
MSHSQEESKSSGERTPNHHSDRATMNSGSKSKGASSAGIQISVARSAPSKESTKTGPKRKSVRFTDIQIRDYERTVGDNPSCSSGPPICIGWAHGQTRFVNIDSYEHSRSARRTQRKLVLNRQNREALLAYWAVPVNEIVEAIRGNVRVKNQRRQTVTNLGKVEKLEEAFESAARKLKKTLLKRRKGGKLKGYPVHSRIAPTPAMGAMKLRNGEHLRDFHAISPAERATAGQETSEVKDGTEYWGEDADQHGAGKPPEIVYENDDTGSSLSGFTIGNSTTASIMEIERFYRELEMEMFGDLDEPPSMVGQTLEVPGVNIPDDQMYGEDTMEASDRSDLSIGTAGKHRNTSADEVLKNHRGEGRVFARHASEITMDDDLGLQESSSVSRQRNHGTRIPQYFHDNYEESPHPAMYGETSYDDYSRLSRTVESLDLNHSPNTRNMGGTIEMPIHYQYPAPTMRAPEHFHRNQHRRSLSDRRVQSLRDGPEIRYMPLQAHISPSQFMGEGIPGQFSRNVHEPVTICEDTDGEDQLLLFGAGQSNRGQQYFNHFPPEPQFQDLNGPPQTYYR